MTRVKVTSFIFGTIGLLANFGWGFFSVCFLMLSADFLSESTFLENSFKNTFRVDQVGLILVQIVLIQITPDILSELIWVQPVCKGYQQKTLSNQTPEIA